MRQRLAIAISAIVAAAVLAVGLTAAGFAPEPRPAAAEAAESPAIEAAVEDLEPEIVYLKPAPKPKTVVVKKRVEDRASGSAGQGSQRLRASRSGDESDDDEDRREHRRESAKERQEDRREAAKERREEAKERREREDEDEDDD
jgi:hypothetical protein